jgi:hypothetical protein
VVVGKSSTKAKCHARLALLDAFLPDDTVENKGGVERNTDRVETEHERAEHEPVRVRAYPALDRVDASPVMLFTLKSFLLKVCVLSAGRLLGGRTCSRPAGRQRSASVCASQ